MDANPWTYQVMGEEMGRWYTDVSLDPRSPQPGDARQYGYVQLAATGSGVASASVDVQLSGSATWYRGDLGSGYPLHGVGQVRTVVKLPTDWESHPITSVRVRVFPASAAASVQVQSLSIEGLDADWTLSTRPLPTPSVVGAAVDDPVAVGLQVVSGGAQVRPPGAGVSPFVVRVTDSLDEPLEGVPVTFARTSGPALMFVSCSCATVDAVSDAGGVASSGALDRAGPDGNRGSRCRHRRPAHAARRLPGRRRPAASDHDDHPGAHVDVDDRAAADFVPAGGRPGGSAGRGQRPG